MAAENENGLFQTLAPGERETVQERIWDFLAERAGRYAMGESTSLPEETAGELLESVLFCTQKGLAALGKRASWLAGNGEVRQAFSAGLSLVREEARQAAETLSRVREYSWFGSDSRRDAVFRDIPQFFRLYDPEFFACRIPCLIDYPLCLPVRGDGIDYVARYLWGLERESRFCARFPEDRVRALLRRYCPGYERVRWGCLSRCCAMPWLWSCWAGIRVPSVCRRSSFPACGKNCGRSRARRWERCLRRRPPGCARERDGRPRIWPAVEEDLPPG